MSNQRPEWWPENPYPESLFWMTVEEYVKGVPDENIRTALSGCLGRLFWDIADKMIYTAYKEAEDESEAVD